MTPEAPLTPRQTLALQAVLETQTQAEAARLARVNPRTLRKWAQLPQWTSELRRARARLIDSAASALASGATAAARALVQMATLPGRRRVDPGRVAAARAVIDQALAFVTTQDFLARLEAVERRAAERDASPGNRPLPS